MSLSSSYNESLSLSISNNERSSVSSSNNEHLFDLTINGRIFEVAIHEEPYSGQMVFSVAKGSRVNARGCVVLTFYPDPDFDEASMEWFGYDTECTKDRPDMDRGQTKSMLIGSLLAFREFVQKEYGHVNTIILSDEANFKCPGSNVEINTIVASIFLHNKTYYQRLLNVQPHGETTRKHFDSALKMVNAKCDDLNWFLKGIKNEYETEVIEAFQKGGTWRDVVKRVYANVGCDFFESCYVNLRDMFKFTALLGSSWSLSTASLPLTANGKAVTFSMIPLQEGSGKQVSERMTRAKKVRKAAKAFAADKALRTRTYRVRRK